MTHEGWYAIKQSNQTSISYSVCAPVFLLVLISVSVIVYAYLNYKSSIMTYAYIYLLYKSIFVYLLIYFHLLISTSHQPLCPLSQFLLMIDLISFSFDF